MLTRTLHHAGQIADALVNAALADLKLTARQYSILAAISDKPMILTDITEQTHIDRSTLSTMAMRMAEAGMVSSKPGKGDSRVKVISLTIKGRTLLNKAQPLVQEAETELQNRVRNIGKLKISSDTPKQMSRRTVLVARATEKSKAA